MDNIFIGKKKPVLSTKTSANAQIKPYLDKSNEFISTASVAKSNTFDRVKKAYDLERMENSRVIVIGTGGAASFLEELGRAGLGQFVLIDPDTVSETNLATQQVYRKDIGRYKTDCIAERIRDINPSARTWSFNKSLDEFSDAEIKSMAQGVFDNKIAKCTVICGLTDNFYAQARVNRLSLTLGIPSLCAQVYAQGRGAEVSFTYPGITPACHRCALGGRYRYFLEEKKTANVTSHGTPIFATTRLNAIKGYIMLAILHHGTEHQRWGSLLKRIGKRNLVQIRLDPDLNQSLGLPVFNNVFKDAGERVLFDETLWLPQDPECPKTGFPYCADCGGTGNLLQCIGKIEDTRLPKPSNEAPILTKG